MEVKGVQLKSAIMFLKDRYGEEAYTRAVAKLAPEDRALLPPMLLDSNWYPNSVWRAIRRTARDLVDPTEKGVDFPVEMGKYMATYAFTGVYKSLMQKTPIKLVQSFKFIQDFFSRGSRDVETTMTSETSCTVKYRYEEGAQVTRATCPNSMGFWVRSLELSGASNVKAAHVKCTLQGNPFCEFTFEWK